MSKIKVRFIYSNENIKDEWRFVHEPFIALEKRGKKPFSAVILIPADGDNKGRVDNEKMRENVKRIGYVLEAGSTVPLNRRIIVEWE